MSVFRFFICITQISLIYNSKFVHHLKKAGTNLPPPLNNTKRKINTKGPFKKRAAKFYKVTKQIRRKQKKIFTRVIKPISLRCEGTVIIYLNSLASATVQTQQQLVTFILRLK
jgi:hypothetical protein